MSDSGERSDDQDVEEQQSQGEEQDQSQEQEAVVDEELVLDLDAAEEYEEAIDQLTDRVEEQQEQIEELNDLLMDLSTRVADGRGMGVCTDCHGPVMKVKRLFSATTIECRRCGRVYHEY